MRNLRISCYLLLMLILLAGCQYSIAGIKHGSQKESISFEKMTEGKISFELVITESEEPQLINVISSQYNIEEIVFSIPVVSGDKLYPYKITPEKTHSFVIEFDLRYNFCKVYIDGNWLTSILARKQFAFINGINSDHPSGNNEVSKLNNLLTEGALLDFKTPVKIVALGASSVATRRTLTGVFCQRLPEYFKKQNIPVHVFNEGIGGSHSGRQSDNSKFKIKHALDRFDEAVLSKDPDFVIINLGINDSWVDSEDPNGESRIPLPEFRENILYMLHALKERDVKVILLTPQAIGKKHASWRYKRTEKYIKALRKIAGKEKLPLLDQWKMMNKLAEIPGKEIDDFLLSDSMHTNDQWHQITAEAISDIIIQLISARGN